MLSHFQFWKYRQLLDILEPIVISGNDSIEQMEEFIRRTSKNCNTRRERLINQLINLLISYQILHASHLIEPELMDRQNFNRPHRLTSIARLPVPFCPGLPCRFPTTLALGKAGSQGASPALSIVRLADEMVGTVEFQFSFISILDIPMVSVNVSAVVPNSF